MSKDVILRVGHAHFFNQQTKTGDIPPDWNSLREKKQELRKFIEAAQEKCSESIPERKIQNVLEDSGWFTECSKSVPERKIQNVLEDSRRLQKSLEGSRKF